MTLFWPGLREVRDPNYPQGFTVAKEPTAPPSRLRGSPGLRAGGARVACRCSIEHAELCAHCSLPGDLDSAHTLSGQSLVLEHYTDCAGRKHENFQVFHKALGQQTGIPSPRPSANRAAARAQVHVPQGTSPVSRAFRFSSADNSAGVDSR